jgi:hypothetical protein
MHEHGVHNPYAHSRPYAPAHALPHGQYQEQQQPQQHMTQQQVAPQQPAMPRQAATMARHDYHNHWGGMHYYPPSWTKGAADPRW